MRDDYAKISKTAIVCAVIRSECTDMPYAKSMTDALKKYHNLFFMQQFFRLACMIPSLKARFSGQEIRHLSTNDAMTDSKVDGVLELASGLSARGMELSRKYDLYLETDLPGMISIKEKIVADVCKKSKNHKLSALNPLDYDALDSVGKKYFAGFKNRKIAIVNDGLINYFSIQEKQLLVSNIARFFRKYCPKGVWITHDFSYREKKKGVFAALLRVVKHLTGRKLSFFGSDKEALSFLASNGLKADIEDNSNVLDKLTSTRKMNLKKDDLKAISDDYRVFVIKIK
jgi:O-methyltransferase involved in polyketide biosynthesis